MADSSQGWQYPQLPAYQQGPVTPGPVARPPRPEAMQRAVNLMYLGAALGIIAGIVNGLTTHNVTFYYNSGATSAATVHDASSLVAGILQGIIDAGLWLWMAWKTGAGRSWARVLSAVFFGFMCLELIGGITSLARNGTVLAFVLTLAEWGVGLAALIYLWKRESSEFFGLAKQARLARAYGAAYSRNQGYQVPGYGQPPHDQEP